MLSKDTRYILGLPCLLICVICGIALYSDEKLDPNEIFAAGLAASFFPLTLFVSAIRSIIRSQAVLERVLDVEHQGTRTVTTYRVEIVFGPEAVRVGWQRTVLPVVCFAIWLATLALRSDWTIPLSLSWW
jgi:hypothetical protein